MAAVTNSTVTYIPGRSAPTSRNATVTFTVPVFRSTTGAIRCT
ncbi:MAG: hypothetical protein M5U12_11800 [Verrucomicrobia bacterium]|nr:hypothetical protein [Verrucomicrobiota bacterium]